MLYNEATKCQDSADTKNICAWGSLERIILQQFFCSDLNILINPKCSAVTCAPVTAD
jgi:hypothetical protein